MNLENSLTFVFSQVINEFRYNFDLKMNEIDLHGGQIFVLVLLWKKDKQSQAELGIGLNLSAPTIHKMINSLARGGFVESLKCEDDARIMRVCLTAKGAEYQKIVETKFKEFETEFFVNLTETEKLIFNQIIEKFRIKI